MGLAHKCRKCTEREEIIAVKVLALHTYNHVSNNNAFNMESNAHQLFFTENLFFKNLIFVLFCSFGKIEILKYYSDKVKDIQITMLL